MAEGVKQAAKDRAYDYVKRQVLRGAYEGGDLISEGDVSKELQMSRTPVREAFLRLEIEGLLRLYPQRGALVVAVSPREIRSVLEAREVLEQFAVRKLSDGPAAPREALDKELAEHLGRQRELFGTGDVEGFLEEDRLFHTSLLTAADNALFLQLYTSLRDRQVRMIADSVVADPGRSETILAEHAEIAEAVRAGDGERAQAAVRAHLASTRAALGLA
ncbi:GntR family transcriptional regulator [Streptomyces purpurogeneiscleroticus]|uniref:GntR family transcriptional regulator n=1 Tax=Streptomyces purpurogeneiscleroticus TaxID=68259 RepID=UPI001CBDA7BF|nr:GntR family transcriptional regulator [Streptomyces purpurogeneiscleroticus]MBZ4020407.1 GntR family transcriptional regulator [Streptomyces purpurogeneiscleroticus]